jgi:hypothetical protein
MRVRVYHNVSPDLATRMVYGYQLGHPLVHVFETDIDPGDSDTQDADELAEWIWTACNTDLDPDLPARMHAVATAYRHCGLRSLSVGDLVAFDAADAEMILKVDGAGFSPVRHPLNVVTEHQHGTWPWTASARTATAWVLRCWNRDQDVTSVHPGRDAAIAALATHARQYWTAAAHSGGIPAVPPVGDEEAVRLYYSHPPRDYGDGYDLRSVEVTSPPAAVPPDIAAEHPSLALDLATADGRAIYDLFCQIKRAEARGCSERDAVSILTGWLTSCGIATSSGAPELS